MIRGIDSQIMIQQSVNAARVAGEQLHNIEQQEDFKMLAERERLAREAERVQNTEKAEHRRVEEDESNDQNEDEYTLLYHKEAEQDQEEDEEMTEIEEKAAEKMKKHSVGSELDISV